LVAAGLLAGAPSESRAQTGTIEGLVTLEPPPPPRRTANRYPGGATTAHEVQRLPVVAYLVGPVGTPPPPGPAAMVQRDTAFVPSAVVIPAGTTIDFPNDDPFFHNVFSYSPTQRFDLGRYPRGESKAVTFDTPGIVSVFCEVHDFMRGAIVVTENPFHAVVAEDGTFRITGVPPGEHVLAIWHADHRVLERTVNVTSGGTFRIEVELRR
jgi:hypothetical protein